MKRWKKIVAVLVIALVGTAILFPSRIVISREIVIDAPAVTVFALLNDFRQVNRWSGWREKDPNVSIAFAGPGRGKAAEMVWTSHILGNGSKEIVESVPYVTVTFARQDDGRTVSTTTYSISARDGETRVATRYDRSYGLNLPGRIVASMVENVVALDLERDLSGLRQYAESLPQADFSGLVVERLDVAASTIAYLETRSAPQADALSEALGDAYFRVRQFIDRHSLQASGSPLSITRTSDGAQLTFDAAIPVSGVQPNTPRDGEPVKIGSTYEGPAIRVQHRGPFATLGQTHEQIAAWLAALGVRRNGPAWEVYISDPTQTVEAELLTHIYYPVQPGD